MAKNDDVICTPDTWTLLTDEGPETINMQVVESGRLVRLLGTSGAPPDPSRKGGYRAQADHGARGFVVQRDFGEDVTHIWAFSAGARVTVYVFHA